ncbi:MAG: hypothetical protein E7652_06645 [Ruminococcaceae bacterium]|nr:hypothetical protein [Oscillospiraceae bacterium]
MKKILALLICIVMLMTLVSCTKVESDTKDKENEKTEEKREKRVKKEDKSDKNDKKKPSEKDDNETEYSEDDYLSYEIPEVEDNKGELPTPELLCGSWTGEVDLDYMFYTMGGESFEDLILSSFEGMDLSGFEYNEEYYFLIHLTFANENEFAMSMDMNILKDYFTGYMNALLDYMASPEFMAVNSGITVEEFEALLASEGMTTEDYSLMMKASMLEDMGDIDEMADGILDAMEEPTFEESGTYTIDGYEIIPEIESEEDEEEDEEGIGTLMYENGSLVLSVTEENEIGKQTTITVFFEKDAL